MNETDYQGLIVKDLVAAGGLSFKMQNEYLGGIPDIFMAHPEHKLAIVELKLIKHGGGTNYKVTPKQARWIKWFRKNNISCVVGVVVETDKNGVHNIYMTENPEITSIRDKSPFVLLHKQYGKPWPVIDMIETAHFLCNRL